VAAPCATHGVVAFFSAHANYPLLLYKHTAGPDAAEIGALRLSRTAVLQFSPNPFQGSLRITGDDGREGVLSIFDISGHQVFNAGISAQNMKHGVRWDAKNLSKGLYLVRWRSAAGQSCKRALLH
jgi:hypothetical protein